MSTYDPKRTCATLPRRQSLPVPLFVLGVGDEAARFHQAIAGSAVVWPLTVRAQQGERMRRLGIIMGAAREESETKARITTFLQELKHLGRDQGRNVQIEMRATADNAGAARKYAAELVEFAPDAILAIGGTTVAPLLEATHLSRITEKKGTKMPSDGVAVVKPGQTYVGKQGFTYGAGASSETVGAQKVCMNVLPMSAGAVAKAHYHKGIETIAFMLEGECAVYYGENLEKRVPVRQGEQCFVAADVPHAPRNESGKPCTWLVVHSSGSDQDGIVMLPELDAKLVQRLRATR